jgi:mitofilin
VPKKRHVFRKLVIYTTAATATFYVGSAFVAFKSQPYNDFFVQQVPGGPSVIQYAEDHNWDTLTTADVINFLKTAPANVQKFVNDTLEGSKQKTPEAVKEASQTTKAAALSVEEKLAQVGERVKTTVKKTENGVKEKTRTAKAIALHQASQFSEGVEELVRKAEEALKDKAADPIPEATTTPSQPAISPLDHTSPVVDSEVKAGNVYDTPLPIGHEIPFGYSRPKPAPKAIPPPVEATPAPVPLPLIAPAVSELATSEPIITQLASTIDNLAAFLSANPTATKKAHDVLDTARIDLTELATRMEKVKEEERIKLEQKLDDQAREYTLQLLDLEMSAQDKLDHQEEDFRKLFDQERVKFIKAYREKLNHELQTQSELINER